MQKKLIALAVAGLAAAPVFAQSNVTIYGVVDAGLGVGHADNVDFRGVVGGVLSGNRIGFKGAEELGNGLKAVFQLEQGFNIDDGTFHQANRQFSRQAYVGLQGAFGTVSLGRQYAPGYFAGYDAALSSNVSPQSVFSAGGGLTITPNSPARWNNAIAYTGSFSGFTARAIYSANDTEAELHTPGVAVHAPGADDKFGLGLDYANGPLKVGAVFQYLHQARADIDTRAGAGFVTMQDKNQREWYVGGSYDFGFLEVDASFQAGKGVDYSVVNTKVASTDPDAVAFGADQSVRLWNVGVIVPVSAAGKVHVDYGRFTNKDSNDADARSWTLAYTHALSKRTTGYAAYQRVYNDKFAAFGAGQVSQLGVSDEQNSLLTVGMRHTF
ncbi:porin [Azoarcus sp. KH32C]|uniref:porin n=1 Tax=Azoarcus sp. KH32C TaxID=748247 RepID=UPI000238699D|nr:porin [Azoarcus sp. KH32C]BAL25913.1 outer membrane protein [Azoarcus sp. KH32C]